MNKLILIGGAAGTGKTTLSQELAKHFLLPWISTDQIRSILKIDDIDHTTRLIKTWGGVHELIKHHHPWEGGIIEGTAILPEFVARDFKEADNIQALFLVQDDIEEITKVIEERSKLPWINTKTQEQKTIKIKEVLEFNIMIQETAQQYRLPCFQGNKESTLTEVLNFLH